MEIIELSPPTDASEVETAAGVIELTPPEDSEQNTSAQMRTQSHETDSTMDTRGFLDRFGDDFDERAIETVRILERNSKGEQTSVESFVQLLGKTVAGTALDFIGEGLVSAFRTLPDGIENPIREQAAKLLSSEDGKKAMSALAQGVEKYEAFAKENPRAARNIESIANVALLAAPAKGGGAAKGAEQAAKPGLMSRASQALENSAEAQVTAAQRKVAQNLITPKQTAKVREAQVARESEQGLLRTVVTEPTAAEARMIDEVAKIPGVKKNNTLRKNYAAVNEANKSEAIALKESLKANEVIFPRKEFAARLNETIKALDNNPLLVGDAGVAAKKVAKKMEAILLQNKSTGSGLLKARKELDIWIKNQKGNAAFDPAKENALSIAVRDIRQTTNDFLAEKATNVAVKESLRKQSTLYGALENIAPKAALEERNIIKRAIQNVTEALPVTSGLKQTLAATGLVAAPAIIAPNTTAAIVGTGLAVKGTVNLVRSPGSKKALSKLIHHVDKAIVSGKMTPKDLAAARVDRAALAEILNSMESEDE